MKKARRFLAFLLVSVMLASAMPIVGSAASALDGKTIVCFGDSLTQGTVYWVNNGLDVYPDILADKLSGSTVINAGSRGDSTYNAIQRYKNDVIAKNPDIVIMCFGMNDQAWEVQYNRPIQTLDMYIYQLTTMITDIQAAGADVILMTPNPVYEAAYNPTYSNNYEYGLMPQYCAAMRKLAVELGCGLIDMNYEITVKGISTYVSSDGIHQTVAGHKLYAECVANHLSAVYDNVNKATMTAYCKTEKGNLVDSYALAGASGANITLPMPELEGHTVASSAIGTTFSNGKNIDIIYKSDLEAALSSAESAAANSYSQAVISQVRALYGKGLAMLSPTNTVYTAKDMSDCAHQLNEALSAAGGNAFNKSFGTSYTTTTPNYFLNGDTTDTRYCDDGIRLTDGVKSNADGENLYGYNYYSAWSGTVNIYLDLGETTETNVYRAYVAGCAGWGITAPSAIGVAYSDDNVNFTPVTVSNSSSAVTTGDWNTFVVTATAKSAVNARYIRITLPGGFVWVDEVEAALIVEPIKDAAYVNGFNGVIVDSDAQIFTSDFGNLSTANLRYTANLVAEWSTSQNAYIVTEVFEGNGTAVDRALADNEIIIAVHYGTTLAVSGDAYNYILGASVGQKLCFDGIDLETRTVSPLAYIYLEEGAPELPTVLLGDVNDDGVIDMFDYLLVKSFYFEVDVPTADEAIRADMNEDGVIDMFDYLMVKTAYFNS